MAVGDAEGALKIADEALARPSLSSPIDRAQLDLLRATLRHDETAREQALLALIRLLPNDPAIAKTLADVEMNARRFPQAVSLYREIMKLDPEDVSASNLLGYAQAFAGDIDGAKKSFEEYGRKPGQEANSLDSLGEAMFLNGKFGEAEKYFLDAHAKNSAMLQGGDLIKAAYARWLAGDLPKADQLFAQYKAFRTQLNDPLMFWREAVWEYSTGRAEQAMQLLESVSGQGAQIAQQQLAVWHDPKSVSHDPAVLKPIYERTPPSADGLRRTLYAAALLETGQTEEARKLVALWPLPEPAGDDLLRGFLYPRFLELRRQLK
jgi:tetratricopeptide (TPR) repeat protein